MHECLALVDAIRCGRARERELAVRILPERLSRKIPTALRAVAKGLGPLRDSVAVGGMIRGLLITDPAAGPLRPTDDVDMIIDVPTLGEPRILRFSNVWYEGAVDHAAMTQTP